MKSGYLYIATGEKFIAEAAFSAESLRRRNKKCHITLITDENISNNVFDTVLEFKPDVDKSLNRRQLSRLYKINGMLHTPYERTVFIDTDTFFCDDCSELFDLLDIYDIMVCHDFYEGNLVQLNNKTFQAFPGLNTGVIAYRKNEIVDQLFYKWLDLYKTGVDRYSGDQPAFMDALLYVSTKLLVLHSIYNFRFRQNLGIPQNKIVKIIHGRLSLNDFYILEQKLNTEDKRQRAWVSKEYKCFSWNSKENNIAM